jgi:glycosyltransferase involved in cell wall biosynthesis
MKAKLITTIPVYNAARFITETLDSVSAQTMKPDRVIIIDNCSTDNTKDLVSNYSKLRCEWVQNPRNLGLFGNCNRALAYASETEYLQILHADDLIDPAFYETLSRALEVCPGRGLAFCLDERIDEKGEYLSRSGRNTGAMRTLPKDEFLREKAEIGNQAFCASLMKTSYQAAPCQFRESFPMLADMVFWAEWGYHCSLIVRADMALAKYRWHGTNTSTNSRETLDTQALVLDEWRTMELVENLRGVRRGIVRNSKLKGLFAVRSGIKAKRFREQQNSSYSDQIIKAARPVSGPLLWALGQAVVHTRDLLVYGILRRRKHPRNIYS